MSDSPRTHISDTGKTANRMIDIAADRSLDQMEAVLEAVPASKLVT